MPAKLPTIDVIAGRNGAGKTTFAKEFLPKEVKCLRFLNADEIARGPCWWMTKMGIALSILAVASALIFTGCQATHGVRVRALPSGALQRRSQRDA